MASQRPNTTYSWGVEGTDSSYSAPGAAKLITLHNNRDQPAELLFHDGEDRLLSRVEFLYDQDGNLVEEAQTKAAEMLLPGISSSMNQAQIQAVQALLGGAGEPMRRTHRYNEQGRRIETQWQVGPLGSSRRTVEYNDHGDQIEEVSDDEARDYNLDDDGQLSDIPTRESTSRSEARFRYDYDAHGNWVSKTIEGRVNTDQDFTLSTVERRTLAYFE